MREADNLTTFMLHVANVMKIWEPKPPRTLWATPGLLRDCFTFSNIHLETVKQFDILLQESLGKWGSGKHKNQHDFGVRSVWLCDC